MTLTVWRVFVAAFKSKADLIHIHDPELIPVGLVLRLMGKKVIYDAHEDLETQIRAKYWLPKVVKGGAALIACFFCVLQIHFSMVSSPQPLLLHSDMMSIKQQSYRTFLTCPNLASANR